MKLYQSNVHIQDDVEVTNFETGNISFRNETHTIPIYILDGTPEEIVTKSAAMAAVTIACAENATNSYSEEEYNARVKNLVNSVHSN